MKFCTQVFLILLTIVFSFSYYKFKQISEPKSLPIFDYQSYWGPGAKSSASASKEIKSFKITDTEKSISTLTNLLDDESNLLRFQAPLEGIGFQYGVNSVTFYEVLKYWRNEYLTKWTERLDYLNSFPQFTTQIQGLNIHYIHIKPTPQQLADKKVQVIPLLLIHGWPGSVREFYEIIPKLAKLDAIEKNVIFELIVPSLPGYGWSQGSSKPGFGVPEIAIVLKNLMTRVGHEKFYVQGGDWGSIIGSSIATIFPNNVIGYHSNLCGANTPLSHIKSFIASFSPSSFVDEKYQSFYFPASEKIMFILAESGYMHLQASKPDTIGIVLSTNPIGLAAYIFEKFSTWTNPKYRDLSDGGWSIFDTEFRNGMLDNIMIYYLTNSITTSQRLYSEFFRAIQGEVDRVPANVPTGCARFANDLAHSFDWQLIEKFPQLVHSTHYSDGGHFIAFEKPNLLFDDFKEFVRKVRKLNNNKIN